MKTILGFLFTALLAIGVIISSPPAANAATSSENKKVAATAELSISEASINKDAQAKRDEASLIVTNQNEAATLNSVIAPTLKNEGGQASNSMAQVEATDGNSLITKSNQNDIAVANQNINAITGI